MEVASEGEIKTDEPAALDFPIRLWVPSPSPHPRVHHQTPDVPGLPGLRRRIRVIDRSRVGAVCRRRPSLAKLTSNVSYLDQICESSYVILDS